MNTFGACRFCGCFFWVITKLDYIYGSFLCILGSFLKVKVQNWRYFWAAKNFLFFFGGGGGCLKFLKFILGEM